MNYERWDLSDNAIESARPYLVHWSKKCSEIFIVQFQSNLLSTTVRINGNFLTLANYAI